MGEAKRRKMAGNYPEEMQALPVKIVTAAALQSAGLTEQRCNDAIDFELRRDTNPGQLACMRMWAAFAGLLRGELGYRVVRVGDVLKVRIPTDVGRDLIRRLVVHKGLVNDPSKIVFTGELETNPEKLLGL